MAKTQKRNLFSELVEKRSIDNRRFTTLDGSRWKFGYQVFRAYIGKMIILNLLLLVFSAFLLYLLLNRNMQLSGLYVSAPFSANLGFGYMPYTQLAGLKHNIVLSTNLFLCKRLPIAGLLLGFGLAGGLYVMRNILWLEEVSVFKDFFKGIAKNFNVVIITLIYSLIMSVCIMAITYADFAMATGIGQTWHTIAKIASYVSICLFTLMFLNGVVMTVTYKVSVLGFFKNTIIISFLLLPINVFIMAIAAIPFLLTFFGGVFAMVGYIIIVVFGLSYILLVWTNYSHWIYERFLAGNTTYEQSADNEKAKAEAERREAHQKVVRERLASLPIKPFTEDDPQIRVIPSVYTLADVEATEKSILAMREDSDKYYQQNVDKNKVVTEE